VLTAPVPPANVMADAGRLLSRRLAWLVFTAATALLLVGVARQRVDAQNRALKAPDGPDAVRLAALGEIVPDRPTVLLAFLTLGELPLLELDQRRIDELRERLAAVDGVAGVAAPIAADAGCRLVPVAIAAADPLPVAAAVLDAARRGSPPSLRVLATGLPIVEGTIAQLVAGERATIVPLLLAVLFAAAWVCYRSAWLAAAMLLSPIAAIAWTSGAIAWLGHALDPVAALLDPVLLTIGVAASVHLVEAFRRAVAAGENAVTAARTASAAMRTPAVLATATTMIGLWSVTTSDVPAVVDFGVRSAFGVALAHLFAFALLPAWLACAPRRALLATARRSGPGEVGQSSWFDALRQRRTPLLTATAALTALAAAGLTQLTSDNDPLQLLPADTPERAAHDELARRLGGVETFHLLVPAGSSAAAPERLLPFVAAVRELPGVAGPAGPVLRGAAGDLAVPLLLAPSGSAVRGALFAECERVARCLGLDGVVPAGSAVQIANDSRRLLHGLGGSLALSAALLLGAMVVGLRSFRLGALAMLPNVLPALWVYGALGWLGRPVSVATAMIGCTMLGLIVDNTLHLLHRYASARGAAGRLAAMRAALASCARPMALASGVLMLGFLTAATSRLATTVEFALLASATLGAAWLGTAFVLPLLVVSERARTEPLR
jgi:predicted RND superfamily exporter protein